MKHFKLKAVSLILAILAGILVSCFIVYYPTGISRISKEELDGTLQVLKDNNIKIDPSIIPALQRKIAVPVIHNALENKEDFAKRILGAEASAATSSTYATNHASLSFQGNTFELHVKDSSVFAGLSNIDARNAGKKIQKSLTQIGFDLSSASIQVYEDDQSLSCVIEKKIDGYPVFDDQFTLEFSGGVLHAAEGVWFDREEPAAREHLPHSAASALVEFALNDANTGSEITELTLGYRLYAGDKFTRNISLTPVWRIITADNLVAYIDA